ncbi:MAG: hypothetical protein Q9183_004341, partial [Haloplaca sp. 2 TL-2023]
MLRKTAQLKREVDEQIVRTAYKPAANLYFFDEFAYSTCCAVQRCALPYGLMFQIDSLTVAEAVNHMESVNTRLHIVLGAIALEKIRADHLRQLYDVLENRPSAEKAASKSVNKTLETGTQEETEKKSHAFDGVSRNLPSETTIWSIGCFLAVTTSAVWLFAKTPGTFWKGNG